MQLTFNDLEYNLRAINKFFIFVDKSTSDLEDTSLM